jgi:hypothetical protein
MIVPLKLVPARPGDDWKTGFFFPVWVEEGPLFLCREKRTICNLIGTAEVVVGNRNHMDGKYCPEGGIAQKRLLRAISTCFSAGKAGS